MLLAVVGHRKHQRGHAADIRDIYLGSGVEQRLDEIRGAERGRRRERRERSERNRSCFHLLVGAVAGPRVHVGPFRQQKLDGFEVSIRGGVESAA